MFCGKTKNRKNKPMGSPNDCLRKGIGIGIGISLKKKTKPKKPAAAADEKKLPAMLKKADQLFAQIDNKKKKESKKKLLKKAVKKAKQTLKRNNKVTLRKYKE